jgi:cytochrome c oxidase subunit I
MMLMRWQLAYPGEPLPFIGGLPRRANAPAASCCPSSTTSSARCTARSWCSSASCRSASAAFGNYLVPLQIGAPDMAFPRLNMASYWFYFGRRRGHARQLLRPGRRAESAGRRIRRWPTRADRADVVARSACFLITSSLLGSVNFIVTIIQLRAPGLTFMRLPFFVWAQFITAFLLLLAFPPLEAAAILQLMDRVAGTSFFMPSGLVVSGQPLESPAAAARCSGSTSSGSSPIPRSTC